MFSNSSVQRNILISKVKNPKLYLKVKEILDAAIRIFNIKRRLNNI